MRNASSTILDERDLVLEHLADDAPGLPEDELAGHGDRAVASMPTPEAVRAVGEPDATGGRRARGCVGQLVPRVGEGAEQRRLDEGALVVR